VLAGVKYFLAVGDEKKMQDAKKSATFAIVGIILAMGSFVLMMAVGQFFK